MQGSATVISAIVASNDGYIEYLEFAGTKYRLVQGTDNNDDSLTASLVGFVDATVANKDLILGFNGNDRLFGGDGDDALIGGEGDDELHGWDGDDDLVGGSGDDSLDGGAGADTLDGGAGIDKAIFSGAVSQYDFTYTSNGVTASIKVMVLIDPSNVDTINALAA